MVVRGSRNWVCCPAENSINRYGTICLKLLLGVLCESGFFTSGYCSTAHFETKTLIIPAMGTAKIIRKSPPTDAAAETEISTNNGWRPVDFPIMRG